jgi:hypothetical protein
MPKNEPSESPRSGPVDSVDDSAGVRASATTRPGRNGGTLQSGNPGNKGGLGAVPSEVRQLALEMFRKRLPRLDAIAGDELIKAVGTKGKTRRVPVSAKEQRQAIVALGRLGGMATKIELEGELKSPLAVGVLVGPAAAKAMHITLPPGATE